MAQKPPPHPRNLPTVLFIEDEERFLKETGLTEEQALMQMRSAFQQLRSIKEQLTMKQDTLREKLPDTEKTLQAVQFLKKQRDAQKETRLHYELIGGIYAKAKVPPTDKVGLWMGANVMLEYSLEEAEAFLTKQINDVNSSLEITGSDLHHIEDQINTVEVSINRMRQLGMAKHRARLEQQQQQQIQQMQQQQIQQQIQQQQQQQQQAPQTEQKGGK